MVRVLVELVAFTLHEGRLRAAAEPVGEASILPASEWNGVTDLDSLAASIADRIAPKRLLNPTFVANFVAKETEPPGLSIGYYVCVAPNDLVEGLVFHAPSSSDQPNSTPRLRSRQGALVFRAFEVLQQQSSLRPLIPAMLEEGFTLTQFQDAVGMVTGVVPDKRHFRRHTEEMGWLEYTGEKLWGAHRPAMLYRLSSGVIDRPYVRRPRKLEL